MHKKYRIILLVLLTANGLIAQKVDWKKLQSLTPDKILLNGERQPTQVLLLGTFHFNYPQLDAHKTDSSKFINVLSPERQKEMQELADVIKRFKPTRIYVESVWPKQIDSVYNEYIKGKYKLGRNETYQLGFRVASQMGLKNIYSVDTESFAGENENKYPFIDSMWNTKAIVDTVRDKYWNKRYNQFYTAGDSVETTLTMLENFLLMAEPSTLYRMYGAYLTGGFNTSNNDGPDILSMWWYNRNLRIFNNILKTKPGPDDRIMILFGNGHVPILKHCFQSSPEFRLVELKSLVK